MLINFSAALLGFLDQFIRFDNMQPVQRIGCVTYTLAYGGLSIITCSLFTLLTTQFFVKSILQENPKANKLQLICMSIAGTSYNINDWQNPELLRKLRFKKNLILILMIAGPIVLNTVIYAAIVGFPNITNGTGLDQCHPMANIVAILFFIIMLGFNLSLLLHMKLDHKNDIFKLRNSFFGYIFVFAIYGSLLLLDYIHSAFTHRYLFPFWFMTIMSGIASFPFVYYPLFLLRTRKKKKLLTIQNIYMKYDWLNSFKAICEASYCSNYVMFIDDYKMLNWSKPLEVQRMSKKYFDVKSPLYLDLIMENFDAWTLDLKNPDHYSMKIIDDFVHLFLQRNIIDFLDSNQLKRTESTLLKV